METPASAKTTSASNAAVAPASTQPAPPTLSPADAWTQLPASAFDAAAARHLLRRVTWSAQPDEVARAVADGLPTTLARLFPAEPVALAKPKLVERLEEDTPDFAKRLRDADPLQKRVLQKEARDRSQQAYQDMSIKWLQFSSAPAHAAQEKWTLFLSDIYVISFEKIKNAGHVFDHQAAIRRHAFGPAPALTKAISRTPAMIRYLDLQDSKRDAPNENFARELFELFVLGEGNYTEKDIKEAARAFTGYRQRLGEFSFVQRQHDPRPKTVFGKTAAFTGDDIIDLAYKQPAAGTWLPHELVRFYLTDDPLPPEYLPALGQWWSAQAFDLRALAHRFFGSQLFFSPSYRGNYIKSPVQFYLALTQDLQLDVAPLARQVLGSLRQMGQTLYNPPNVRGWVGGRQWINSATFGARRQLVQTLFNPINEANLNADEQVEIVAARADGKDRFVVDSEHLKAFAGLTAEQAASRFLDTFLPGTSAPAYRDEVTAFLKDGGSKQLTQRVRNAAIALLQSPEYQLC
ncbi:hypothetical protein CMV30_16760 [Nibricoccus aquaticus]|uniref:DUF1800 domain-containing protein n=1 Tax=Nibricoccus aquaticus TaxID=2576891 RepID=A0A290QLT5_9BACT|nr:DUF1800 domain-containing protein [Nibricoccus aquaticus]ATC65461.1 hypothetical protein CMV30_16760 [Nibricoccus aquaticus]